MVQPTRILKERIETIAQLGLEVAMSPLLLGHLVKKVNEDLSTVTRLLVGPLREIFQGSPQGTFRSTS